MALKQKDRFLKIDTVLENPAEEDKDDNFILLQVAGAEGVSMPYAYNLVMIGPADKNPDPAQLIGSRAAIGIKHIINPEDKTVFDYRNRFGVFEQFARVGTMEKFKLYNARLVPAFKLTSYETRYRVFEDLTVEQIIRAVLARYSEIELNVKALEEAQKLPYVVQFGETTFNFVHRLLDRFGLHYRFEHELNPKREVMVLAGHNDVPFPSLGVFAKVDGAANARQVGNIRRYFNLATRQVKVGNFNELNPPTPFRGEKAIDEKYDLMRSHPAHEAEVFPVPVTVAPQPKNYAEARMRQNEATVFSVTGQTANTAFRNGRTFIIDKESTDDKKAAESYLVKTLTIFATDSSSVVGIGTRLLRIVMGLLGLGSESNSDVASAAAQNLLDQIKKDVEKGKEIAAWLGNKPDASNPSALPDFLAEKVGRVATGVAGALPAIIAAAQAIKDLIEQLAKEENTFSCAFEALPFDQPPFLRDLWPTPDAVKPVAHGPHLAMVIGPDGIDAALRDIHVDALGRVRLRFPWDPGPFDPADPLFVDPVMTGLNTCWARVSEGWAGERFGTQFLPRIGQEVLVGFVDGNPEHPMVVGRAYNARGHQSNLTYLPPAAAAKSLTQPDDLRGTETDQATRSGIRSRSTPRKPEGQSGFHMMRLEDKQGEEQFLLRSERRLDVTAYGSHYDTTRGNLHILVGGKHEEGKPPPGGSMFTTVGGEKDLHVGKDLYENIDAETNLTTKGNVISDIGAAWFTYASDTAAISGESIILQAKKKITLRVGAASIVITPASIWLDAAMINNNQGGTPDELGDITLTDAADAAQADPGDPPDWLARQPKGGPGKRRTHDKSPKETAFVTAAPDGKLVVGTKFDKPPGSSKLQIDSKDPHYADQVVNDLVDMANQPGGSQRLENAMNGDKPVVIKQPAQPTDPPTASTTPDDIADSTAAGQPTGRTNKDGSPETGTGRGSGSTVNYDPNDWPREGDPNSPNSTQQLGNLLDDAANNRQGLGEPNRFSGQVPPAPPPQPPAPPQPPPGITPLDKR